MSTYVMKPRYFQMTGENFERGIEKATAKEYCFQMEEATETKLNSALFSIAYRVFEKNLNLAKKKAIEWQLDYDVSEETSYDELFEHLNEIDDLSDVRVVCLKDSDLRLTVKVCDPKIWYGKDFHSTYGDYFNERQSNLCINPLYSFKSKLVYLYYSDDHKDMFLFRNGNPANIRVGGTRFCHTCFGVFSSKLNCYCFMRVKGERKVLISTCKSCGDTYKNTGVCPCKRYYRIERYKLTGK